MTSAYRLTPKALSGYVRVVIEVEEHFGTDVALGVEIAIERALDQLANMPRSGHVRPDLTQDGNIRFWSVGPTLIAYRLGSDGIEIVLIELGAMDWVRLLDRER